MNTSNAREQRANEEIDIELEYERVRKQRYEDFQEWLNKCPLVVTTWIMQTWTFKTRHTSKNYRTELTNSWR